MNAESMLIEKYRQKGIMPGQELLLRHDDALCFIDDCERENLIILGLDFYVLENDKVIQVSSADYSSLVGQPNNLQESIIAARKLIRNGLPDGASWVSFVVKELESQ
jgi:hypothetical protein